MTDDALLEVLHSAASAVRASLDSLTDWGLAGTRPGQYMSDLAADEVAIELLLASGLGVMSEESGAQHADRDVIVVLDPVDGSTNAARGIPWFATSLCAIDRDGARAAVVVDQARDLRYEATRGGGARAGGRPLSPSGCTSMDDALVALSGLPPHHLGWRQYRAFGAAALDLCAVAAGHVDGYIDCSRDAHGPWDYLGGMLICQEAGVAVADAYDRDLVSLDHADRRTPIAAATPALLEQLRKARRSYQPSVVG